MVKIAVACDNGMVSDHFGHCEAFLIVDVENNEVIKSEMMTNPRHQFGFLPNYLADLGINVVISGRMGKGPFDVLIQRNVEVIVGVNGNAEEVVKAYLEGSLKPNEADYDEYVHQCGCGCHGE